jgi:DHA2 family multidrug resistance protein
MDYTATLAGDMMAFNGVLGLLMAPLAATLMNRVDPRILLFIGISIISSTTLFRVTFASNIDWNHMILPQLAFGLGMPLFFVPLMGMTMASVKKEETASAAGLINFIRTTSAAIATAIVTTAWSDQATSNRVQLSGRLNDAGSVMAHLQAAGQTPEQARQSLDNLVQGQSVMVATNQMFLVIGAVLGLAALAVWLMPKPKGPVAAAAGH